MDVRWGRSSVGMMSLPDEVLSLVLEFSYEDVKCTCSEVNVNRPRAKKNCMKHSEYYNHELALIYDDNDHVNTDIILFYNKMIQLTRWRLINCVFRNIIDLEFERIHRKPKKIYKYLHDYNNAMMISAKTIWHNLKTFQKIINSFINNWSPRPGNLYNILLPNSYSYTTLPQKLLIEKCKQLGDPHLSNYYHSKQCCGVTKNGDRCRRNVVFNKCPMRPPNCSEWTWRAKRAHDAITDFVHQVNFCSCHRPIVKKHRQHMRQLMLRINPIRPATFTFTSW